MAALVEGEGHRASALVPSRCRHLILVTEQLGGRLHHPTRCHLDHHGDAVVQRVAGLGVLLLVEHGLHTPDAGVLDGWHALHIVDIVLRGRLDTHRGVVAAVLGERAPRRIVVGGIAVGGQRFFHAALPRPQVMVAVEYGERRVGGRPPEAILLIGHLHPVPLRSAPLAAPRRFGVLLQQGDGILVGIHLLVHRLLAVVYGVPELVGLAPAAVYADVAVSHFPRVFPSQRLGPFVVVYGSLRCCRRRHQRPYGHHH